MKRTSKIKLSTKEIITGRMLELMEYSIDSGKIHGRREWCEHIDFNYRNFSQVRGNIQGFTDEQKLKAAELAGADMNWIYGRSEKMLLDKKNPDPIELIEEGLRIIKSKNKPVKTKVSA